MNQFEFKGGVDSSQLRSCKFLLFFLNGRHEISFFDAKKMSMVEKEPSTNLREYNSDAWATTLSIAKVFLQESDFGMPKFQHVFYLALGATLTGSSTITISPRSTSAKVKGFKFKAVGKFIKKEEMLQILDENSIAWKLLKVQKLPPVEVLRQIVSIERKEPEDKAILGFKTSRHIRV